MRIHQPDIIAVNLQELTAIEWVLWRILEELRQVAPGQVSVGFSWSLRQKHIAVAIKGENREESFTLDVSDTGSKKWSVVRLIMYKVQNCIALSSDFTEVDFEGSANHRDEEGYCVLSLVRKSPNALSVNA